MRATVLSTTAFLWGQIVGEMLLYIMNMMLLFKEILLFVVEGFILLLEWMNFIICLVDFGLIVVLSGCILWDIPAVVELAGIVFRAMSLPSMDQVCCLMMAFGFLETLFEVFVVLAHVAVLLLCLFWTVLGSAFLYWNYPAMIELINLTAPKISLSEEHVWYLISAYHAIKLRNWKDWGMFTMVVFFFFSILYNYEALIEWAWSVKSLAATHIFVLWFWIQHNGRLWVVFVQSNSEALREWAWFIKSLAATHISVLCYWIQDNGLWVALVLDLAHSGYHYRVLMCHTQNLAEAVDVTTEELQKSQRSCEGLKSSNSELEAQVKHLCAENETLRTDYNIQQTQLTDLRAEKKIIEEASRKVEAESDACKAALEATATRLTTVTTERDRLRVALNVTAGLLAKVNTEREACKAELNVLTDCLGDVEAEREACKADLEAMAARLGKVIAEREALKADLAATDEELKQTKETARRAERDATAVKAGKEDQIKALEAARSELTATVRDLCGKVPSNSGGITTSHQELIDSHSFLEEEFVALRVNYDSLVTDSLALGKELDETRRSAWKAEETVSRLREDLDAREGTIGWVQSTVEFLQVTIRATGDNGWVSFADKLVEFSEVLDHRERRDNFRTYLQGLLERIVHP